MSKEQYRGRKGREKGNRATQWAASDCYVLEVLGVWAEAASRQVVRSRVRSKCVRLSVSVCASEPS